MDILSIFYLVAGFIGLIFGGDLLVRGAVAIAARFGVSPFVIGLTLVGFGTSTPELLTSVNAALSGASGIAVGNVVGSNIANVFLIIGIAALIAPMAIARTGFVRDGAMLCIATLACFIAAHSGALGRGAGFGFLALMAGYLIYTLMSERKSQTIAGESMAQLGETVVPVHMGKQVLFVAFGLALTLLGAKFLVQGAVALAAGFGVSETLIGLTIVAVGTSMPELVTSVIAARKGQAGVAFGNVLGSNIFNILGILGVVAIVQPIDIPPEIVNFDIWVMAVSSIVLLGFAVSAWRITRTAGAIMLASYVGYTVYLIWQATLS
ncbi:sodium:calcium antiporter [Amylibacter kogurei]|uniref:Sodium:calcium antiporter n=1 Tax=Paramylibacter kogurei TaxID=1889778 RepID=A0A2G5K7H7_9RHOB|nr:calcium/sodium antiporter [Amylibacter kogurei]PIB24973.1 sodium:calcium antiporter [Amylibacter kogurei]